MTGYLRGTRSETPFLERNPVEAIGFRSNGETTYQMENVYERPWKALLPLGIPKPAGIPGQGAVLTDKQGGTAARGLDAVLPESPFIVLHPFSGWRYRSWPLEEFVTLAKALLSQAAHDLVFICRAEEEALLGPLKVGLRGEGRVRFFPSSDLAKTAALLSRAELFIGNDSGPIHLASYLGLPVIGLYGPAPPSLVGPPIAHGTLLYKKVPCSPCVQTECVMPERHCMRLISADEVAGAALRELRRIADVKAAHA
jgi:ADP-heptose:LPS heptosyltransferase